MRISDWSSDVCSSDLAGTASMIAAAAAADVGRFVHVSSLAAREPELSAYGRSKAESERSEEHTSELPVTNAHLVCRLPLEKKKSQKKFIFTDNIVVSQRRKSHN